MRVAVLAALMLAGCAGGRAPDTAGDASALAAMLAGRTPAPAGRCISLSGVDGPTVVGGSLVYRDGRRLLVSTPPAGCPALGGDPIVVTEVFGGQLCAGDRFHTLERGSSIPGPDCRFGPFVPWATGRGLPEHTRN
ncbi:hypothetical protein M9980_08910 [Sphingomonas donggukensis]|uniref:Lipoprotein n=1 Tax=Sphingomonas donggukensis TaxID=2949093 RepID=A0ABY4TQN4_9SPHN|nr:hypothetical protein [Sphingomonas donggukensis]URW74696.1 hypothetical protein M9980_08910 [Sphingomonas donggukensis]